LVTKTVVFVPGYLTERSVKIGYMRVSKSNGDQTLDLQRDALIGAGIDPQNIYSDMASGKKDDRPGLENCLRALRAGDQLIVWRLDRLGRNLSHLLETVNDLTQRGIGFKCLTGVDIDTATPTGRFVLTIFAGLSEFERELIRERTIAGLAAARARGKEGGRRSAFDKTALLRAQAAMRNRDCSVAELCAELGITKPTLYRNLTPAGELTEAGQRVLSGKRAKLKKERRAA
jgi:DNA invertase Pin-like site-specific DNA recombinase